MAAMRMRGLHAAATILFVARCTADSLTNSSSCNFQLPVIDVAPWLSKGPLGAVDQDLVDDAIVGQLDQAFSEFGFAVVVGHGVEDSTFDRVSEGGKEFFRSELANKQEYDVGLGYGYGGYSGNGGEAGGQLSGIDNKGKSDIVESLTCRGLQHIVNGSDGQRLNPPYLAQDMSDMPYADRIPAALLAPTISLHNALFPLKTLLTRATERVMGVEVGAFQEAFDPKKGGIRWAYYPELESCSSDSPPIGYGAHADSGGMVVLRLDAKNPTGTEVFYQGQWIPVPVNITNAIVLNGGTVMQRLTGGRWKAAIHRVVRLGKQERLSIVYGGMVPQDDLVLSSLAFADLGKHASSAAASGQVVRVKDYLDARVRMQRPETDPRDQEFLNFVDNMGV